MALRGWRRSWEMRATILLRVESGSSDGRSGCTLHNDSAGKDRRRHTARSSIQTLPSAIGRSPGRTISCSGITMHSLWSALKKRNYLYVCGKCCLCLQSYITYHHPVHYLGHIRNPDSSKKRHFFDSSTYQFGPSFWQYSFLLKRALMRQVSRSWGSRTAE
jgi:hypothetical protein